MSALAAQLVGSAYWLRRLLPLPWASVDVDELERRTRVLAVVVIGEGC